MSIVSQSTLPVVEELTPTPDVEAVFASLSRLPHCLFLDSAQKHANLGRYSFLAADPFEIIALPAGTREGLQRLAQLLASFRCETVAELPPFQGGAAGLFSYDLNRSLEKIASPRYDEFQIPAIAIGLYDVIVAFDHQQDRAWVISQGFPENEPRARRDRAAQRLQQFQAWLNNPPTDTRPVASGEQVKPEQLAPQFPTGRLDELTSTFSKDAYLAAIQKVVDYIYAGDVFQVNLAQRLLYPARDDSISLYQRLRKRNPAPFAGYFDLGPQQIISASPERFVSVRGLQVEARPIKGTRQRTALAEADLFAGDDLMQSEKDRAENVMIVDLLRNDLSRVCRADSVRVSQLCQLESYQFVQHLVSAVCGELAEGRGPLDLVRAAFPGGSITGAPKVRAMEIIAEIEPTARGAYCGSLGYLGFDGALDLSILIRTITAAAGWWQMHVGGGIVAQSKPHDEYEETWHKAQGLLQSLEP